LASLAQRNLWYPPGLMRNVWPLLFVLAWLAGAADAWAQPAGERASLQWVENTLRAGDAARALRGLGRALKRTPTPALALRFAELALPLAPPPTERARAQREKAAQLLLEVLALASFSRDESSHLLSFHAAWAHALCGDFDASLALLEQVGAYDGARAVPVLRAVAGLALPNGVAVAERSLRLAQMFAPTDAQLLSELGLLWLSQGRTQDALPLLAAQFAKQPGALTGRRDYAYALSAMGRPAEAYALLNVAQDACRETGACLIELARFALEAKQPGAALEHLKRLQARAPRELGALFLEADVHLAEGQIEQAKGSYQRILELAPHNLRARAALLGLNAPPSDDAATTRP
jgi:tetratricopeptide (TPR) repeat protein